MANQLTASFICNMKSLNLFLSYYLAKKVKALAGEGTTVYSGCNSRDNRTYMSQYTDKTFGMNTRLELLVHCCGIRGISCVRMRC